MKRLLLLVATVSVLFVACNDNDNAPIAVQSVTLSQTSASLIIGETLTLVASVHPANAEDVSVTWQSSDTTVAIVENGTVKGISAGTTTITVITLNGHFTATSEIKVTPDPSLVANIRLPETSAIIIGNTTILTAIILPETATNRNVIWSSSDNAIATVENGVVTAIALGATIITATTEEGNHTATTKIEVYKVLPNFCNTRIPLWGDSIGTISWGTIGNTDINSGATTIIGRGGRHNQVWSGAVFASACADKTRFNGGIADWNNPENSNFNADCSRAHTELTGHFFSWCAVVRFADQLCPAPWRVPTREDFRDLDLNLGGTGYNRFVGDHFDGVVNGFTIAEQQRWYISAGGTGSNPQIGGTWGGARFTGLAGNPTVDWSLYWSSTEQTTIQAFHLTLIGGSIGTQTATSKYRGHVLRCVRQ